MDRSREARRGVTMAASNGLSRRRHRSNSLRDSPEDDGPVELQETARLRDRKKDRDRDRERDRDRLNRNNKRRRSDKFMHGSNREDGGEDSSEESVNDDEDEDEDDGVGAGGGNSSMRMLPPNPPTSSSSVLNHHHHHHNSNSNNSNSHHSRKSFPPPAKVFRASSTVSTSTWKAADEMIGVPVPRKARSASTKRSHECWSSGGVVVGGGGEQIHRQSSTSPVRPSAAAVLATPAPASPSSSNASARKKMKPSGPKPRPPKSSGNNKPSSSSAQDEIEIEIAEVLYAMLRQPQCPSKQETTDSMSRENNNINKSSSDAKSRVSSPISNSPSVAPQSASVIPSNSSSSTAPITATAPKRKRPRPVKYEEDNPSMLSVRNSPISSITAKVEAEQPAKTETSSPPNLEKNSESAAAENSSVSYDLMTSQAAEPQQPETAKPESKPSLPDSKGMTEASESGGDVAVTKEEPKSPNKESSGGGVRLEDERRENLLQTKDVPTVSAPENQREEKFQIDLMAPPFGSSAERDGEMDFARPDLQPEMTPNMKDDEKAVKMVKDDANVEAEENKAKTKTKTEESESQKPVVAVKERNIDLQLDLEKNERDGATGSLTSNKLHQLVQKQQQQQPTSVPEKAAQSNSLPLPLSMASWPGGLPPMGYMAPLQGVVSMEGSHVSSAAIQPPHLLFTQPRPKRCATHCYIARNIHYHQQFTRMNPFWPASAGSASLYGAKACNLNVVPPNELHANIPGRGVNTIQDTKGQGLAVVSGSNSGKDNKGSQPANLMDAAQRKQILLQQALPPGAPNNLMQAPAFIFPLSQHQAAAASSVRPGSTKSTAGAVTAVSSSVSNAASGSTTAGAGGGAAAMGFNYPNMPGNETQYLAILQNNAYPFPIPAAHVGAPPAYRGTHAQAMPFFNGSFYSSQMLHPSQLQQQQHQHQQQQQLPQPIPSQSQPSQQGGGHQNASISSGSSSSQKHLQNQQQQRQPSMNGGNGTLQGFPAAKNQPQQQLQQHQQQRQHQQNQQNETGGEESPSTADSRVSRMNMNIYGQNFAMPGHSPPTFALMTNASMGGSTSVSGNHGEKKSQQQQPPHTFPMSFASINGATTAPGFDLSSIAQNPAILPNLSDAMRHGYQIVAAAQAAQQKKNYRVNEEGNKIRGNDGSTVLEEEKKSSVAGKPPTTAGQSVAFSRPDLTDGSFSNVVDTSSRTLNFGSAPALASMSNVSVSAAQQQQQQQQMQRNQQQQHQMIQLQKQQQYAAASARSKTPATSNGNVFTDHMSSSSSMAGKFPNALSGFPQNLVQNSSSSSSPGQSPQWKNTVRINTSQVTSSPLAPSMSSSHKNLPPQQGRTQQSHAQISFAANPNQKASSVATQGQKQGPMPNNNNNSTSSPPVMVFSPTTSSVSKSSAGGSPRTTATASSGGNKGGQGQVSSLSSSGPSRKSSPVPSILGNPNAGSKLQMTQQQQQQLFQKQALHQAQLLFTNASYMQAQAQAQAQAQQTGTTTSSAMAAGGLFMQRSHRDQQQQQQQQVTSSSTGVLSLCPPLTTHSNTTTSDPAKAVAAASNNMKGGGGGGGIIHPVQFSTSVSSGKPHHLVAAGFPYVHAVPTAVQVKPTEQKQQAGEKEL